jgi:hypothetical protein
MNPVETAIHSRVKKMSANQACLNHLKAKSQSARPESATLTEVQKAAVAAHENLNAAKNEISAIARVNCPCVLLGADECFRTRERPSDGSS